MSESLSPHEPGARLNGGLRGEGWAYWGGQVGKYL